jgi:hypothetical protein
MPTRIPKGAHPERNVVFDVLLTHVKAKALRTAQSTAFAVVAGICGVTALVFFLGALFVWLELRFSTIEACLMFGGGFVVLAGIAVIGLMITRRRPNPSLNVAAALPWNDPALMMGIQAAKSLGGRRAGAVGLIGAFVIGIILSRTLPKK